MVAEGATRCTEMMQIAMALLLIQLILGTYWAWEGQAEEACVAAILLTM